MSYTYTPGDGVGALDATEPADTDQIKVAAIAIRQIKAYLKDNSDSVAPPTLDEVNTLIAAATGSVTVVQGQNLFRVKPTIDQNITHPGAGTITTDVVLATEIFDLDNNFAANIFTAPAAGYYVFHATVQLSVPTPGALSNLSFIVSLKANGTGGNVTLNQLSTTAETSQRIFVGSDILKLALNETVKLSVESTVDAACTLRIEEDFTRVGGYRIR